MSTFQFAPQLFIKNGVRDISFYTDGLGAVELRRWSNDDGTIHVAELSIGGALFHLHEENSKKGQHDPLKSNGVTSLVGLFVDDVDGLVAKAINAGAKLLSPAQDYDYGFRQAHFVDPFGHHWLIESKIG